MSKIATDNLHGFSLSNSQVVLKGASKKLSLLGVSFCLFSFMQHSFSVHATEASVLAPIAPLPTGWGWLVKSLNFCSQTQLKE